MNTVIGLTPKQQFEKLLRHVSNEINRIDAATPWQQVEPDWWLHMMQLHRSINKYLAPDADTINEAEREGIVPDPNPHVHPIFQDILKTALHA